MNKTILFICLILFVSSSLSSHSGRTDSSGGHNDRKNGTYHYHNGGSSSSGSSSSGSSSVSSSNSSPVYNYNINQNVYINQDSNIRRGSSADFEKITTLSKYTRVKLLELNNGWAKIEFILNDKNTVGWVASRLLSRTL